MGYDGGRGSGPPSTVTPFPAANELGTNKTEDSNTIIRIQTIFFDITIPPLIIKYLLRFVLIALGFREFIMILLTSIVIVKITERNWNILC